MGRGEIIASGRFDDPNFDLSGLIAQAIATGQEMVEVEFKQQENPKGGFVVSIYDETGDPTGNRTPVARMRTWCPSR